MLTIPNLLTLARLVALPAVVAAHRGGYAVGAAVLFAAVMATDLVDGWVARALNQRSKLGVYLDPVVDKIVILGMFYELALNGVVPLAAAHLFLARELLQNAIRGVAATGGTVVGANWMGKTKALLQTGIIVWGLLLPVAGDVLGQAGVDVLRRAYKVAVWSSLLLAWGFFGVFLWWNRRSMGLSPRDASA